MVVASATQSYGYMPSGDCEYCAIVIGGAMVFLWISGESSTTVRYQLVEPHLDVGKCAEEDFPDAFPHLRPAVAQMLSPCLMA